MDRIRNPGNTSTELHLIHYYIRYKTIYTPTELHHNQKYKTYRSLNFIWFYFLRWASLHWLRTTRCFSSPKRSFRRPQVFNVFILSIKETLCQNISPVLFYSLYFWIIILKNTRVADISMPNLWKCFLIQFTSTFCSIPILYVGSCRVVLLQENVNW